ncbi:DNA topoisomerase IV [Aureitalea marina]|uniref:DNA topoisomerase IV n=1 Tax=Aureitalea marina TaxID=930804 RepID=A0A2S7KPB5_9FLAO|nr:DNA topoisomerase IV [Aureitalea marina]PQB04465.1 DNA topoisomerase IV [Aureitalea marina]
MKLTHALFASALIFLLGSCYQTERNCTDFKTGTFQFEALVGTEMLTTTFVRNDSIEIDYFQGKADTSAIRWINDCEYIVKKNNPRNMAEEKAIHMKILSTDGPFYTFEYNVVGQDRKERGTARKVDESQSNRPVDQ